MKKLILTTFALIMSCMAMSAQEMIDKNFESVYNRSQGEKQQAILNPSESLRYVCIVNPGDRNETHWTLELMKWMLDTGKYNTVYIDMPAFDAMMLDNYVKSREWMTTDTLTKYCSPSFQRWLHVDKNDMISFLKWIRQFNNNHDNKVSIRGLNYYTCAESVLSLMHFYPKTEGLVDSLKRLYWESDGINPYSIVKNTKQKLEVSENVLRSKIGDDYDVFKQFVDQYKYEAIVGQKKIDSLMFNSLMYQEQRNLSSPRNIIFMNLWSLRTEPSAITFRTRVEELFKKGEYLIYNLVDDIEQ